MTGKAKVRLGDGKAVGKAEAERDDEAMDYLLKPSPLIVAGLTLGVAIAKATAVAKLRIKQFWAIPLAGKVVAGPCMMAMLPFRFSCEGSPTLTLARAAGRIASGGDRYTHEDVSRMAGRTHEEKRRLVAQRQECRDWAFTVEPAAKEFGGQQVLGEGASEGEGNAGRRGSDAQAFQANATGCV